MVEELDEEDSAVGAAPSTINTRIDEACQVLAKPDEAGEDVIGGRKFVDKPAAVVDIRVVAVAAGCQVSVQPSGASTDRHVDARTRNSRAKAMDVKVVATPAGCNVAVTAESGSTQTTLDGDGASTTTARPASRAHHMDLAVLPQPGGGCHVHVRPDGQAADDGKPTRHGLKPGEVNVHIAAFRAGAGCRVELGGSEPGGGRPPRPSRRPTHKAAVTGAAVTGSSKPPRRAMTPSGRSAGKDAEEETTL